MDGDRVMICNCTNIVAEHSPLSFDKDGIGREMYAFVSIKSIVGFT